MSKGYGVNCTLYEISKEIYENVDESVCRSYRGQSLAACKPANNNKIHCIEQKLKSA